MNITHKYNSDTNSYTIAINLTNQDFVGGNLNISDALNEASKELAKEYVKENQSAIFESLNPIAVSNLAIAESAKIVRSKFIDPPKKEKESK